MNTQEQRIRLAIDNIRPFANIYPGVITIHNLTNMSLAYMSPRGLETLGIEESDLQKLSIESFHNKYFNAEDAKEYAPQIMNYVQKQTNDESVSFFQQVYSKELDGWKWYHSTVKMLLHDDDGTPLLLIAYSAPIDPHHSMSHKVDRLLEENTFLRSNYQKFSSLGEREKDVLKLLSLGKSSQEISAELFMSVATADTHRRNIKRKLGTQSLYELQNYARAFDLI